MTESPQASENANKTSSTPAEESNKEAVVGENEKAPQEAPKADAENGEGEQPKPELSEADQIRKSMQKRIDRMTAANRQRDEHIASLNDQIRTLSEKAPKPDDAPKQEDFEKYEDWEKANIEYQAKKQAAEIRKQEKEAELAEANKQKAAQVKKDFDAKEATFSSSNPDYQRYATEAAQTMTELGQSGINIAPLRDMVMQFESPPEMIYHLGKDPSLIEELVEMSPLQMMRKLVELENSTKAAVQAPAEQAPKPIDPPRGGRGTKPLHERSGAEILEWAKRKK